MVRFDARPYADDVQQRPQKADAARAEQFYPIPPGSYSRSADGCLRLSGNHGERAGARLPTTSFALLGGKS